MSMKKGIALLITVAMIALISAVALSMLDLVDRTYRSNLKVEKAIQDQVLLKNFHELLNKMGSDIASAEALDMIMGEFPGLSDDTGRVVFDISIASLQGRINMNAMLKPQDKDKTTRDIDGNYRELLYAIFNYYHLVDPGQMIALIADTIDEDTLERYPGSELANEYADISNGAIQGLPMLKRVSESYYEKTEDETVFDVVWEKYFYFGEFDVSTKLDCNYMSKELAAVLGLRRVDEALTTEIGCDSLVRDQNETLAKYNIAPFKKGDSYKLDVRLNYTLPAIKGGFSAVYDIKDKGINHIRLYP